MKSDQPRPRVVAMAAVGALSLSALLSGPAGAAAVTGPCGTATSAPPAHFDHVVLLIFENKNQDQILSGTAAPYLKGLSQQCGRGTDMNTPDPLTSLGNYIALTSGYYGHPKYITINRGPSTWP